MKNSNKVIEIDLNQYKEINPDIGNEILLMYREKQQKTDKPILTKGRVFKTEDNRATVFTDKKIKNPVEMEIEITRNSEKTDNPRKKINNWIENDEITNLVMEAAKLHGHICPPLVLGVKVGVDGLKKLSTDHKGMEDILAVIETNSCFSDGIQISTGCTFGNNALIYRDYGKTAVNIVKRDEKSIRYYYEDYKYIEENYPEAKELFETVVVNREGTPEEEAELRKKWMETAIDLMKTPVTEIFKIETKNSTDHLDLPEKAPIFENRFCIECEEKIMAEKAVKIKENTYKCIPCSNNQYHQLDGSGLKTKNKKQ